jgi:Reverse transcriptase (RNA-dependent DNA polymerase).
MQILILYPLIKPLADVDKEKWIEAAEVEIRSLGAKGTSTWKEFSKSSIPGPILPGTWVSCSKRAPDGTIKKYKACSCVRGDLQNQVTETFAQVIALSTVRIFLITSILMFSWYTCSIDFSNAFVQAKLVDDDIWIHLPRGFHGQT